MRPLSPLVVLCEGNSHDDVTILETFSAVLALCAGNSPVTGEGQWRGALMFCFICALNKRLSKHSWGWWFETPSRSLWRICNVPAKGQSCGAFMFCCLNKLSNKQPCWYRLLTNMASRYETTFSTSGPLWGEFPWWRHHIGNIFRGTGPLCGEFTGHRWRPVTRSFDVLFHMRLE